MEEAKDEVVGCLLNGNNRVRKSDEALHKNLKMIGRIKHTAEVQAKHMTTNKRTLWDGWVITPSGSFWNFAIIFYKFCQGSGC
jgi:hypothetical protein